MSQIWPLTLLAYLTTSVCALFFLPRSKNWRLRLLVGIIGMHAMVQSLTYMRLNESFWSSPLGTMAGGIEILGGALTIAAIWLLDRQNKQLEALPETFRYWESEGRMPSLGDPSNQNPLLSVGISAIDSKYRTKASEELVVARASTPCDHERPFSNERRQPHDIRSFERVRDAERFPVYLPARLLRFGREQKRMNCEVTDIAQGGARLCIPEFIPPGGLVRVEYRELLFLGEVCWCVVSEGYFTVGVIFEHKLDLAHLSRILSKIDREAVFQNRPLLDS